MMAEHKESAGMRYQTTQTARTLQHKPLSTTEGQRVALINLGYLTEIQGDSINAEYRWPEKRNLLTWMGTSNKKLPMRFEDGLCK